MKTLPLSRFRRNMNSISKKLADDRISRLIVTRRGKPWIAALSPQYYDDHENQIKQKIEELNRIRGNETEALDDQ
ncbi:hypothetical protein [Endozoicomonas lisbonensis]|uniref:PHD/YefM family antitoxin component YafN of YafNO toxin-antitoxin module n=1 Tax=Endozoicomonas lisbonensis TaxID=3120522 RepID=A0ABV2SD87_9GAMM